ncbi:hypothetical protein GHT06_020302 [Daphnia sinensis]|uniref:CCHC-type domain-containing protein n=1 Tax=Daphnia sinensis TaxID=1820382 RepID=A0AAD5KLX4_9CRUS|nr:hypothetical protein GHT06_020302 [Daphnia sinensis]
MATAAPAIQQAANPAAIALPAGNPAGNPAPGPQPPAFPVRAFKPYGSPPPFDLEAERDSFPVWEERWNIFLALSTIDEALDPAARPAYKTNQLKSCLSTPTLQAVLSAAIIGLLRTRCNAGHNRHVWRHQLALCFQVPHQTADNWMCSLRDLSRKCDFGQDCCADCEPTRILGQLIAGVVHNNVRIKLLEQGDALTLDPALTIIRTSETTQLQAASLQPADHAINAIRRSTYQSNKAGGSEEKQTRFKADKKTTMGKTKAPCRYCGRPRRPGTSQCPAYGKKCNNCGKDNHFAAVCESEKKQMISIVGPCGGPPVIVRALPDTESQLDAIPHAIYQSFFASTPLQPGAADHTAIIITGKTIKCSGWFAATIDWTANDGTSCPVSTTIHDNHPRKSSAGPLLRNAT